MAKAKLPDGKVLEVADGTSLKEVAAKIGPRLADAALVAELDGKLVDLSAPLAGEHAVRIVTAKDPEALEVLRHTTTHVMAQAVRRLFGDPVQYTIGPALTDDFQYGFYYDFDLPEGVTISEADLPRIEAEMARIVAEKLPIVRRVEPADRAEAELRGKHHQRYKEEMIEDLKRDEGVDSVSLYQQGEFLDMCRGPHLPDTGRLGAFKLLATAGAYWRGSEKNKQLTRIYGTAFFSPAELGAHLERIAEAKRRDHRVLGRQLRLFLISDSVGPGLPLWMPRGAVIRMTLEGWLRGELLARGYQPVVTPHIGLVPMYRTSGHYPYYEHGLFPTMQMPDSEVEGYICKPMNCPHHIQIYKSAQRSYRELPIRLSEFGTVYRFEQSGELSGLIRARGFTQDDAHIFCTADQLEAEVESCVELTKLLLATLGLNDYRVRVGLRDPDSQKYTGPPENWDRAEENLRHVVRKLEMNFAEEPGEAAFYGPKIDFIVNDCIGREWQLGTIQVDYNLPERFELAYIGPDNAPHRPVMVHRAPLGSLERFIGILIEHYAGAFPLWLSPVQAAVLPVSEKTADYARRVAERLRSAGLRVELDDSSDKVGAKIRRATLDKTPYMLIVGPKEAESGTASVRERTAGDLGAMDLDELIGQLTEEVRTRATTSSLAPPRPEPV